MKSEIERIIDLQPTWSKQNTVEMQERGHLIREVGPNWLRSFSKDIAKSMAIPETNFIANGRDGSGGRTEVPWFRFADRKRSPRTTIGWYCVYLFDTRGEGVYFTLEHGSTVWTGGFNKRKADTLQTIDRLLAAADDIEFNGLEVRIVSAGGTGSYDITGKVDRVTELQCGSYLFMDAKYMEVFGRSALL